MGFSPNSWWGNCTKCSKQFLIAKPTLCCLGSSGSFPFKNIWSFSLRLLPAGSMASCNAAMSIFKRVSMWSVMAVFLLSSILCRSFESPGHMILMFQLARRKNDLMIFFIFPCCEMFMKRCEMLKVPMQYGKA